MIGHVQIVPCDVSWMNTLEFVMYFHIQIQWFEILFNGSATVVETALSPVQL